MLSNEDADSSNEKEIDNLDAIVKEKTISLDLATTQHLFRLACNYANGSKKSLVLVQDLNHIISVKLKSWIEIESKSNETFPHSQRKDRRLQSYEASELIEVAQRLNTPTARRK